MKNIIGGILSTLFIIFVIVLRHLTLLTTNSILSRCYMILILFTAFDVMFATFPMMMTMFWAFNVIENVDVSDENFRSI